MGIDINKLIEVYGFSPENWGDRPPFKGDYINYGYWKNISLDDNLLSVKDRVNSSIELYKEILNRLDILDDCVLEIGCGRGMGIIDVLSSFKTKNIIGIDINSDQIERAKHNLEVKLKNNDEKIKLLCGSADNTSLENNSVDKVYSVEAAQHFPSMKNFAIEMKRILKPNGKLVFTSYFPVDRKHSSELEELLSLIKENLENMMPYGEICECFRNAGFNNVLCENIGKHVFPGYEKWISQSTGVAPFSHNYYTAHVNGYIDYYIFSVS